MHLFYSMAIDTKYFLNVVLRLTKPLQTSANALIYPKKTPAAVKTFEKYFTLYTQLLLTNKKRFSNLSGSSYSIEGRHQCYFFSTREDRNPCGYDSIPSFSPSVLGSGSKFYFLKRPTTANRGKLWLWNEMIWFSSSRRCEKSKMKPTLLLIFAAAMFFAFGKSCCPVFSEYYLYFRWNRGSQVYGKRK